MRPDDYEILYDLPEGEYDRKAVGGIRTVTIRAGKSLEVMACPIIRWSANERRQAKKKKTGAAMEKLNARNTRRHMLRLIESTFTPSAYVFHGTYAYPQADPGMMDREQVWREFQKDKLPEDMEMARRDVIRFLRRVKYRVRKRGYNPRDFKWLYVIEEGVKEQPFGLPPRYHFHMILEAPGLNRDELENLWPFGFTRCDRYDQRGDGASRLANYFTKQRRGGRCWAHSRNMTPPTVRVSDRAISRRRAALMAGDVCRNGREILEKLYPGYRLMESEVKYSDFLPGAYIYCRMRRD